MAFLPTQWPNMTQSDFVKYTNCFMQVDSDRDGKITGEQALNLFLINWRLPREFVEQVWDLLHQKNDSMLSVREFCIALYLMDRYREGRAPPPVLPNSLMLDETLIRAALSAPDISVGAAANSAASQDQFPWPRFTQSQIKKYNAMFANLDEDGDGKITAQQACKMFLSWRFPGVGLKQWWVLSDQDHDDMLSLREFCIALFLIEAHRQGWPLPAVLPNSVMFDETLLQATGQPSSSYGGSSWQSYGDDQRLLQATAQPSTAYGGSSWQSYGDERLLQATGQPSTSHGGPSSQTSHGFSQQGIPGERSVMLASEGPQPTIANHRRIETPSLLVYSLGEIKSAANNLSKSYEIGKGGYGSVYRGMLHGTMVAIKMLDSHDKHGKEQFFQELNALCQVRHRSLVSLIGACFEAYALVYEFLPNGSLEDCLKKRSGFLTWQIRTRILYDICSVLKFLHSKSLVHGDIKPGNILLDAHFNGKLTDFGLCRFLLNGMDPISFLETSPKGTGFYMDPEFLEEGILRPSSDLYSFGVTILKLLTGKHPLGLSRKIRDAIDDDNLFRKMIDPTAGNWPFEMAKELAYWGLKCCYNNKNSSELTNNMRLGLRKMLVAQQLGTFSINEPALGNGNMSHLAYENFPSRTFHFVIAIFYIIVFFNFVVSPSIH